MTSEEQEWYRKTWNEIVESINTIVDYKPEWANGTGYLNGVITDNTITHDEFKFKDEYGRTAVVFHLGDHKVCLFERFSPKPEHKLVIVCNQQPLEARSDHRFFRALMSSMIPQNVLDAVRYAVRGY